jgi:hypothetical protein
MNSHATKVAFSTIHKWPWLRQTPNNDGVWGKLRFGLEDVNDEAEWLVVFDEPSPSLRTTTPYERRILFVTEPPEAKVYTSDYANQFRYLVSPFAVQDFRGHHLQQQPALNWQYGVSQRGAGPRRRTLDWPDLAADKPKSNLISVICSNKVQLPRQRQRLAFVERLKLRLGDRIDLFGRGLREIDDKQDAIAPYKYHIVLENNAIDHFWTEKLADSYLGDAFPIFAGCSNLSKYFESNSFVGIDIYDIDRAIDNVEYIIGSKLWDERHELIREARRKVMYEYNCFSVASDIIGRSDKISFKAPRVQSSEVIPLKRPRKFKELRKNIYALFGYRQSIQRD